MMLKNNLIIEFPQKFNSELEELLYNSKIIVTT